jgi:hypothetical protein
MEQHIGLVTEMPCHRSSCKVHLNSTKDDPYVQWTVRDFTIPMPASFAQQLPLATPVAQPLPAPASVELLPISSGSNRQPPGYMPFIVLLNVIFQLTMFTIAIISNP